MMPDGNGVGIDCFVLDNVAAVNSNFDVVCQGFLALFLTVVALHENIFHTLGGKLSRIIFGISQKTPDKKACNALYIELFRSGELFLLGLFS